MKDATLLVNDLDKEIANNSIVEPIYMTTTYKQNMWENNKYLYTSSWNPNIESIEKKLNFIEKWSKDTVVFPTWMSAIGAIMLSILEQWDEVICWDNVYMNVSCMINLYLSKFGIMNKFVDLRDIKSLKKTINKNTKLIWIEAPSNPLLIFPDIKKICKIAKENNIIVCVDSTILSSLNISPLLLGADIVIQSATKYIGWTADVMGWIVSTDKNKIIEKVRKTRNTFGQIPSPFNCWLLERWLKTLPIRMKQIEENALFIAKRLEKQSFTQKVIYPWLESFEQFDIIKEQASGNWCIISVVLNYEEENIKKAFNKFELRKPAVSFGWTESLIEYPKCLWWTGSKNEADIIWDKFIRISVWIEDKYDLVQDLKKAFKLKKITKTKNQ